MERAGPAVPSRRPARSLTAWTMSKIGRSCADFLLSEPAVEAGCAAPGGAAWRGGRFPGGRRLCRRRPACGVRGDRRAALLRRRPRFRRGGRPGSATRAAGIRHRRRRGAAAGPPQRRGGQPAPGGAVDGRPALRPAGRTDRRGALARPGAGDRRAAAAAIGRAPLAFGSLACVLDQLVAPSREVAVVGPPGARVPPGRCSARCGAAATPTGRRPGGPRPRYPCSPDGHRSPAAPPPTSVRGSSAGRPPPTPASWRLSSTRSRIAGPDPTARDGSLRATSRPRRGGRLRGVLCPKTG